MSHLYSSWTQVSGYFDGDGNVGLEVVRRVLKFKIRFVDTWRPQIESISSYLIRKGISCGDVGEGDQRGSWQAAYRLDVTETQSVLRVAKAIIKHTVKKQSDLRAIIDYIEGKTTGNQALAVFNEAVESGRRRGKIRTDNIPYTRDEGLRLSQLENARKARSAHAVNVSTSIQESIRKDHRDLKLGHIRLSKKYGYSVSVIRRVLSAR